MLPTLEALGIGFVPFSPLGRGFLTGRSTKIQLLINQTSVIPFRALLRNAKGKSGVGGFAESDCKAERQYARTNSPGVVACAKAMDCSDPWYYEAQRLRENNAAAMIEIGTADLQEIETVASTITVRAHVIPNTMSKRLVSKSWLDSCRNPFHAKDAKFKWKAANLNQIERSFDIRYSLLDIRHS